MKQFTNIDNQFAKSICSPQICHVNNQKYGTYKTPFTEILSATQNKKNNIMTADILQTALSQVGVKEIAGKQDNTEILKYFDVLGYDGKKLHDETAWCSAFANWVAIKSGYQFSGKLNARSWLKLGKPVTTPVMGDIVVLWRQNPQSWKGHVGFYIREYKEYIYLLGGNQNNQVNISVYPKNRLLEYRKLSKTEK